MKLKHALLTIFASSVALLISSSATYASTTVHPYIQEAILTRTETQEGYISFKNDENKTLKIAPQIYSYNPKDQTYIKDGVIFTEISEPTYSIEQGKEVRIDYRITPKENMRDGTYFNLIVLESAPDDHNDIGLVTNLSHLVVLQLTSSDDKTKFIGSDFADITLKVSKMGIPFLLPTTVKYTVKNTTNYVLSPRGEIQIFNPEVKKTPEYIKINQEEKKLYPNETMSEEIAVNQWNLLDLLSPRTVVGRFYNGIDEGEKSLEIKLNPPIIFVLIAGATLLAVIIFIMIGTKAFLKRKKDSKTAHS